MICAFDYFYETMLGTNTCDLSNKKVFVSLSTDGRYIYTEIEISMFKKCW